MSTTTPEEDPNMAVIWKVIPHVGNHLRTMECALRVGQDTQFKATEKLAQEVKQLRTTVGDFTSGCFQLIFTPGRNKLLLQSLAHTLRRREEYSSPISHTARCAFPHSALPWSALAPFSLPPRPLDCPAPCAPSVLEVLEKNKKVPKYTLFRKIYTIPETWREWTIGTMGCSSVEELDQWYGSCWRPEHKERQFDSVRKVIVEELQRRAMEKGGYDDNIAAVVEEMEVEKIRSGVSLAKISGVLRNKAKQREQRSK